MGKLIFFKNNFLESAQKLEIEGLLGDNTDQEQHSLRENNIVEIKDDENEYKETARLHENTPVRQRNYQREVSSNSHVAKVNVGSMSAETETLMSFSPSSMSAEEIETRKNELYQEIDGVWRCLACSYTTKYASNVRKHVETHIEGLCYTCPHCNKEFR